MLVEFDKISQDAEIFIFQSNLLLTKKQIYFLRNELSLFLKTWHSHNEALKSSFEVKYSYFVIIAIDKFNSSISGCSIDSLNNFFQTLQKKLGNNFFDRLNFYQKSHDNKINIYRINDLKKMISQSKFSKNEIFFNNLIKEKKDLILNWEIRIEDHPFIKKMIKKKADTL